MTGEQANEDQDFLDDDSFVVEGLDENLDAVFDEVEQQVRQKPPIPAAAGQEAEMDPDASAGPGQSSDGQMDDLFAMAEEQVAVDSDDLLFEADPAAADQAPETSPFQEREGSGWPGATLTTEEIGIPAEGEALQGAGDDEVQEVDLDLEDLDIVEVESGQGADQEGDGVAPGEQFGGFDLEDASDPQDESFDSDGLAAQEGSYPQQELSDPEEAGEDWALLEEGEAEASEELEDLEDLEEFEDLELGAEGEAPGHGEGFYAEEEAGDHSLLSAPEEEPVDDAWAAEPETYAEDDGEAVAHDSFDEQEEAYEEDPDYAEHEEAYVDSAAPVATLPVPRRRFAHRMLAAAAVLLAVSAVGVVYVNPEWLGLEQRQVTIDVTRVERPVAPVEVGTPTLGSGQMGKQTTDNTAGEDPDAVTKVHLPPINSEAARTAVAGLGSILRSATDRFLAGSPHGQGEQPRTAPEDTPLAGVWPTVPVIRRPGEELGQVDIGGELRIGGRHPADEPTKRPSMIAEGVVVGTRAVAQLHNGNYFVGTVKTLDEAAVTMKLEKGEVTFGIPDLHTLTALGTAEFDELQKVDRGYVRLSNRNRLVGSIVRKAVGDQIVLETQSSRIVIPRSAIEEIGSAGSATVQVRSDDDAEWVRSVMDQMLDRPGQKPQDR